MLNLFAATGHSYYAKCSRLYLQTMMKLPESHPDVYRAFNVWNAYSQMEQPSLGWPVNRSCHRASTNEICEESRRFDAWPWDVRINSYYLGEDNACLHWSTQCSDCLWQDWIKSQMAFTRSWVPVECSETTMIWPNGLVGLVITIHSVQRTSQTWCKFGELW